MVKKASKSKSSKSRPRKKPAVSSSDQSDQDLSTQEAAPELVLIGSDEDDVDPQDLLGLVDDEPETEDIFEDDSAAVPPAAASELRPNASKAEGKKSAALGAVVGSQPRSEGPAPEDPSEAKDKPSEIFTNSEEKDAPSGEDFPTMENGERRLPIADSLSKMTKGDASQVPQHSLLQNDSDPTRGSAQNSPVNYFRPLPNLPSLTSLLPQQGTQSDLVKNKTGTKTKSVSVLLASDPPEHRQAAHGGEVRPEGHERSTKNNDREVPVPKVRWVEAPPLANNSKTPC